MGQCNRAVCFSSFFTLVIIYLSSNLNLKSFLCPIQKKNDFFLSFLLSNTFFSSLFSFHFLFLFPKLFSLFFSSLFSFLFTFLSKNFPNRFEIIRTGVMRNLYYPQSVLGETILRQRKRRLVHQALYYCIMIELSISKIELRFLLF